MNVIRAMLIVEFLIFQLLYTTAQQPKQAVEYITNYSSDVGQIRYKYYGLARKYLQLVAQEDFDGDGAIDALLKETITYPKSKGGRYFFYSNGKESQNFGYNPQDNDKVEIQAFKNGWAVILSQPDSKNGNAVSTQKYILEEGKAVLVKDENFALIREEQPRFMLRPTIVDNNPSDILFAKLGNDSIKLLVRPCLKLIVQKDFDNDGYMDVLVKENTNCESGEYQKQYNNYRYFIYSYKGHHIFKITNRFGHGYNACSEIEKQNNRWQIKLEIQKAKQDTFALSETYILQNNQVILIETGPTRTNGSYVHISEDVYTIEHSLATILSAVLEKEDTIDLDCIDCLHLEKVKDFDNDGYTDALVTENYGCGRCNGYGCLFYSYRGNRVFQKSSLVEYVGSFSIDTFLWNQKSAVNISVIDQNCMSDASDVAVWDKTYIFENGKPILVEKKQKEELPALFEVRSEAVGGSEYKFSYDLNGDGQEEEFRLISSGTFNFLHIDISLGFDKTIYATNRVGILASKTNGVYDIVVDFDDVYIWNGVKYEQKK